MDRIFNFRYMFYFTCAFSVALSVVPVHASTLAQSVFECSGLTQRLDIDVGYKEPANFIAGAFDKEDFKSIIDAASQWKDRNCRLGNGEAAIAFWLSGFSAYFKSMHDWERSLEKINRFEAAYPESILPRLAEARYWSDFGSSARGYGSASTVTPKGWELFRERSEKSEKILLGMRESGSDWPQWYWQMIRVQSLLDRNQDEVREIFLEGTKKFPDALAIYTEMSYYLEPRWRGSWAAVDNIVSYATKNVRSEDADATYTRMYMATGELMPYGENLFSETLASWPRMRKGFASLLKRYPESTLIANGFLAYACLAEDRTTYRTYRKKYEKLDARAWVFALNRDQCDATMGVVLK